VKLVVPETESAALSEWLAPRTDRVSSILAAVELRRAIRRASVGLTEANADARELAQTRGEAVIAAMELVPIDDEIVARASTVEPPVLRTLDAIHVATVLHIGALEGMVTYDPRLSAAAAAHGVAVFAPGR
jgi:predicted nucleic acid-binding protein